MTRINVVHPKFLHPKHLAAEYRELPRVFALAKVVNEAPKVYSMGKGHVTFFYDKLLWLYNRQVEIHKTLLNRGTNLSFTPTTLLVWADRKPHLWNNWSPTEYDARVNLARLIDKKPDFYKELDSKLVFE